MEDETNIDKTNKYSLPEELVYYKKVANELINFLAKNPEFKPYFHKLLEKTYNYPYS